MPSDRLRAEIEALFDHPPAKYSRAHFKLFSEFKDALNRGDVRAAEPDRSVAWGWRANAWVKKGILLGFRMGKVIEMTGDNGPLPFFDKSTYPVKRFGPKSGVRIVPGGSSVRDGVYVGRNVTFMPPMFVNVGAWIGDGAMIDSHALVGSCAQVGSNCHISAAAQLGGVLEPVNALPVIVEDDVLVGGNCGVYEGTVIKQRAVLGSGTVLNRSTPLYDVVRGEVYTASPDRPLVVPREAVVVAGSRAIAQGKGREWNISLYTPVIVKYRDSRTDDKVQLEDLLR